MTPDTLALIQELEQRVSELSTALEAITESRDLLRNGLHATNIKLGDTTAQLSEATAMIGRLNLHIEQGVEL